MRTCFLSEEVLMTKEIMKTGEAAEYLGLAESTLEKMRSYGGGPAYAKMGRAVRYRRADLDLYVASRLEIQA